MQKTNLQKVYKSNIAPNPKEVDIWVDTTGVLKYYDFHKRKWIGFGQNALEGGL